MTENEIKEGEIAVLALDFDNFPESLGVAGDEVKVIRIDGHGVLVQNKDMTSFYVQPDDLLPFGTLVRHGKPTSIDVVRVNDEISTIAGYLFVILLVVVAVIEILKSYSPQGL